MPVYNGERFLRPAIESILCQTFKDFEFIIVDDGSTDSSVTIIRSYSDERIRLLQNTRNLGITRTLNTGLGVSGGEYICRMDADDISLPQRLQIQIDFMDSHRKIALAGSNVILIDFAGENRGREDHPTQPNLIKRRIFVHNPFAHSSVIIRSSVLKESGYYDPQFLHNEDYDLWLRLAAKYQLANIEEPLLKRRIHEQNITVEKKSELVRYRIKTLSHAIFHYYNNPAYSVFLIRPFLAYSLRRLKQAIT
jgi:glycosyltransferase involved in cell wall biosynthesis